MSRDQWLVFGTTLSVSKHQMSVLSRDLCHVLWQSLSVSI